jgi:hypothetical protein
MTPREFLVLTETPYFETEAIDKAQAIILYLGWRLDEALTAPWEQPT